ncbi:MAG TPA: secondary thiamine-phosphate synthase enzyme YjbQ, partial [Limnochordales bacterium]
MQELTVRTSRRSQMVDVTRQVQQAAAQLGLQEGAVLVYCPHTTAAVTINENADPDVAADILESLEKLVPWQGPYRHAEGNAAAHVRASLVGAGVLVPVVAGQLRLGRWQGIFLCEFDGPRSRQLWVVPV